MEVSWWFRIFSIDFFCSRARHGVLLRPIFVRSRAPRHPLSFDFTFARARPPRFFAAVSYLFCLCPTVAVARYVCAPDFFFSSVVSEFLG